jgi:SAM-dependent methyltransferase
VDAQRTEFYRGLDAMAWGLWAQGNWDEPQHDAAFFQTLIEQNGGVALDVGCGTGRLLFRFLRTGLDVEGCDRSEEMLAICREIAVQHGLNPILYHQAMQALELPRRYRTIFIPCGSFMCIPSHEEAMEALRRFYAHLEPGGVLVFNTYLPRRSYDGAHDHGPLPSPWGLPSEETRSSDGARLVIRSRTVSFDLVEQTDTSEKWFQLYQDGCLLREEVHGGQGRWYFKYELLLMLEKAGFRNIMLRSDYPDRFALCVSGHK